MNLCSSMQLCFQPQAQPSCTWSSSCPLETDLTRVKQTSTMTILPSTSNSNHRAAAQCIDSLVSSGRNIWIYHIKHFIQLALSSCKTKQSQQAFRRKELWGKAKEEEKNRRKLEQVNRRNVSTAWWCLFCVNTDIDISVLCTWRDILQKEEIPFGILEVCPSNSEWQVTFPIPNE